MRRVIGFALSILLVAAADSHARVWLVKPDRTGTAINIQAGIDSAGAGDTVLVAPGTYMGKGNRDLDFKGKPIVVISQMRYDPATTDSSIIDCGGSYVTFHRGFFFHSGETAASVLDGFVITRGYSNGYDYHPNTQVGSGILCDSLSSPTIRYNVIRDCRALWGGSGIFCENSSPIIRYNTIANNGEGCFRYAFVAALDEIPSYWDYCYGGGGIGCHLSSAVISDNVIYGNEGACLRFIPGAGISCILCPSITITNNEVLQNDCRIGGGLYFDYSTAFVDGNTLQGNGAIDGEGGAIYAWKSNLVVTNNRISSNYSLLDVAVRCDSCSVTIESNEFTNNSFAAMGFRDALHSEIRNNTITGGVALAALSYYKGSSTTVISDNTFTENGGGAICAESSSPEISGNLMLRNRRSAISCISASPRIMTNTIVKNSAQQGAGIYIDSLSSPVVTCNIIAGNSTSFGTDACAAIYVEPSTSAAPTISCNDVYANGGGDYGGIPDQTGMNGNFSLLPMFSNPEADDYTLMDNSPCLPGNHPGASNCGFIGAFGTGHPVAALVQDFGAKPEGPGITVQWRLSEAGERMSFLVERAEMPHGTFAGLSNAVISRDGLSFVFKDAGCEPGKVYRYRVDVSDEAGPRVLFETEPVAMPAAKLTLYQNSPNPFNPSTRISYYLPAKLRVSMEIYDVSGALVARLVDQEQEVGSHSVVWDGRDGHGSPIASGVYFCRLTAGRSALSRKMVLLK
jgi:parallel beta-helix repeat protein